MPKQEVPLAFNLWLATHGPIYWICMLLLLPNVEIWPWDFALKFCGKTTWRKVFPQQHHHVFNVTKKSLNKWPTSITSLFNFFSDQVYCARGTFPKLHIKATEYEEQGTSLVWALIKLHQKQERCWKVHAFWRSTAAGVCVRGLGKGGRGWVDGQVRVRGNSGLMSFLPCWQVLHHEYYWPTW